jgi:hypothetical protein
MSADDVGTFIGLLFTAGLGLAVWWAVRAKSLKLAVGELQLAQIYANCPQHRFGGLIIAGSPSDGKLVLTSQRLIFTNPSGGSVGIVVAKDQIMSVAKGSKGPLMTLELGYKDAKGRPRSASFTQIAHSSTVAIDPARELPIGMFIDKVSAWREGRPLPQDGMVRGFGPGLP